MNPLANKKVLLGVTGSIACYKAADLASQLRKQGAEVTVILTRAAQKFITPLTFQSLTGQPAYTDDDLWGNAGHVLHVGLAEAADIMVIAPATANTIAKIAYGLADNLLSIAALAVRGPLVIAPAMDGGMWDHAATQQNIETLEKRGVVVTGPETGHLASGLRGIGRMVEPQDLAGQIRNLLAQAGPLSGKKIVVSAGGTQEPIDPVRVITNRSSGKQGYALAQAALDLGADVRLISAPTHLKTPYGAQHTAVKTASEMLAAIEEACQNADALIMAAAVADFKPAHPPDHKIKKGFGISEIKLEKTTDILKQVGAGKGAKNSLQVLVGFAAESENLLKNAQSKLEHKNLDLIVANDISASDAGFEVSTNRVVLLFADGRSEALPLMSKNQVAERVLAEITALLTATD